ncbi:PAS domain-containing protein [Diaphorobacter sp. HDW4A]|uniref:PAS domain-containing sensor histidine kinase n=1 Tax=Diaphorobacter sp. HDW4A TaxID=2714924 RepID=UPI00140B51F8|nr:ATP-binding protein [Diaphorobacter sp. HDW4A]QIL78540.1 PAS domain-containing protein [Diaphorobacter sp. HDW4A]
MPFPATFDGPRDTLHATPPMLRYLAQGGEVGRSLLAQDWHGNPLGPPTNWPTQLHDTLRITLHSEFPHIVYWGETLCTFWNDAARHFFEGQHPQDLGKPLAEVQPDVMPTLHPLLAQVFESGRAVLQSDIELLYRRADYTEEIHEVFSYSPLFDAEGLVRGIIAPVFDATTRVLGARRMAMLADLTGSTRGARKLSQYYAALEACLARHARDLPLCALYVPDGETHPPRWLQQVSCGAGRNGLLPLSLPPDSSTPQSITAAHALTVAMRGAPRLQLLGASQVLLSTGSTPHFRQVAVVPIPEPNAGRPPCWLVVALNPHKRLDADYENFLTLVATQISQGLADTSSLERAAERALAEISQRARLTTLGELATSIAHEINQPLTAMVLDANACARWLAMQPANLGEATAAARRIAASGDYAGQVLARIRGFLQRTPSAHEQVDLAQVAWDSLRLVAAQARRFRIELRVRIAPALPRTYADRTQLQQVQINLLVNAVDALKALPDERARRIHLSIDTSRSARDGEPCLRVAVADTGPGIAPERRERMFDAFQSTKPEGLGFGLAIARSIIEAHGGRIHVGESDSGGALFWFELPAEVVR